MVFRIDDSRPQWRRDALDGLVDYHVVGSALRQYPRLVFDRKRKFGEIVIEYGGTNPVGASNLQPVGWSLDAWSLGTDGVLPWQTIGTAGSWKKADELSLFYPLPDGVIPSIRLKAYRRGQQDVEYLTLWGQLHKLPRWAVGQQVREALHLSGSRRATETGGSRGRRAHRLLRASSPGLAGPPRADRRGALEGASRTTSAARRLPDATEKPIEGLRSQTDKTNATVGWMAHGLMWSYQAGEGCTRSPGVRGSRTHAADRESSLEVRLRGPQSIMVRRVEAVINTLILKAQAPV